MNDLLDCKKCSLCNNQLPLLDKKDKCDVMWVGLSAKKVDDININYPLKENTNSGKIIKLIEDKFENINFYKTNLVKCLPLKDNKLRYPTYEEMNLCIGNLIFEINKLKPKIIFLLGSKVSNHFNKYIKDNNINIESKIYNIKHPSYIWIYKKNNLNDYINEIENIINKLK